MCSVCLLAARVNIHKYVLDVLTVRELGDTHARDTSYVKNRPLLMDYII